MRPIDADALKEELVRDLANIMRMMEMHKGDIAVRVLDKVDEAPTLDVIPTKKIYDYLQARLDEWNALGDQKYEPANMWGYNFIRACFDDLEEYGAKMDGDEK